ncbi:alanine or glycine:cation symporter, AGCS family [Eubacterium aggregans]|uniref:Alanine or glycine:cation symporter, AGCS family n=2 Tax=Eubacterium aggregans TaxID=81409 RepID=A0A1H4DBT6_9FIRM|nr:sodium:alanine symporter family protein [Eubacterium aggregans]SEA70117.1 alanine or glycine:cation symporter, AGCS family [Eubacterium aggregans]
MSFSSIIASVNDFVWGPIMLALLVGTGVFLTIRLKFLPWRNLGYALKSVFAKQDKAAEARDKGDISPFQSLMTALAATIGTGNIVGVATAMVLGGPGALVWMWISALFGLSTKYGESVLAVKYRETNEKGEMCGGPMYALKNGFKNKTIGKILAFLFSLFAVIASFGIGNMTQANSISGAINSTFGVPTWITGIVITVLALVVLLGGIKSIGKVCATLVPFMAVFYFIGGIIVIGINFQNVPDGLAQIFSMAFSAQAMAGGVGGTVIASALRYGVARGVFSNEAGLGSAPIAAAAAKTDHPSRQGYINMTGTFFDTIIVCSVTGLVIASSGALGTTDASGAVLTGVNLTIAAFSSGLGVAGSWLVTIGIALFAFSTILGWEYYGEKSLEYLVNHQVVTKIYRFVFALIAFVGATMTLQTVWDFSDTMNGLMAIPNLICLLVLNKVIAEECFDYQKNVLLK